MVKRDSDGNIPEWVWTGVAIVCFLALAVFLLGMMHVI
jgi:hypothetical protein